MVFNFPAEQGHPLNLKTYYIKRSMGLAGESLEIRGGQVYINGAAAENPEEIQFRYLLETDRVLSEKLFTDRSITDRYRTQ